MNIRTHKTQAPIITFTKREERQYADVLAMTQTVAMVADLDSAASDLAEALRRFVDVYGIGSEPSGRYEPEEQEAVAGPPKSGPTF